MFLNKKTVRTTAFADFIRNASAGEKKRVYTDVLKKATERQVVIIEKACASK